MLLFDTGALLALRGYSELSRGQGLRLFPRTPFSAWGALPSLRFGQISLGEANTTCKLEMPTSLRSDAVPDHPGMPFGMIPDSAFGFVGIAT